MLDPSAERFARNFQFMPFAVALTTVEEGRFLNINEAFTEIYGYAKAEILGKSPREAPIWADPGDRVAVVGRILAGQPVRDLEARVLRRDGQERWVSYSGQLIELDGTPVLLSASMDITERKRVAAALQEREFFFRESQRAADIGSYKTNLQTGFWESSEVMDQIFGIPPDFRRDLDGWAELVHPDDREAMTAYLFDQVIGQRQPFSREYRIVRRRDRAVRWVFGLGVASFDGDGRPLFLIGTIQDITARKLRDEELQRKTAEMERFTHMVSHDLKSPLVTVQTFLGYLEQDLAQGKSDRVAKDMAFIRDAADRMGLLLDDLLEVSRVGRVVNPPIKVQVSELVREAGKAVAGALASRNVRLERTGPDLLLHGDRPRLEELWQNLLENAVKYMGDQPEPRIVLGVEPAEAAELEPVLFIRDNGMGIDPRYLTRIFGLFEQLDPASAGSGLGLALVKRIVEFYGGRIWAESAGPGQGSCFRFTLPRALEPDHQGAIHER